MLSRGEERFRQRRLEPGLDVQQRLRRIAYQALEHRGAVPPGLLEREERAARSRTLDSTPG
jgi:hypothetical protein